MKKKILCYCLCVSFIFILLPLNNIFALQNNEKHLIVVTDDDQVFADCQEFNNYFVDIAQFSETMILNNCTDLAVPYDLITNQTSLQNTVRELYNQGIKIYLYGDLTLQEYKEALNIANFYTKVGSYDSEELITIDFTGASGSESIVSHSIYGTSDLLVSANNFSDYQLIEIMVNNFMREISSQNSVEIIGEAVRLQSYNSNNSSIYLEVNLIIYKDLGEQSVDYDYYALRTNANLYRKSGTLAGQKLDVSHELLNVNSYIVDYAPKNNNFGSTITINIGTGGVSISFPVLPTGINVSTSQVNSRKTSYSASRAGMGDVVGQTHTLITSFGSKISDGKPQFTIRYSGRFQSALQGFPIPEKTYSATIEN